MGNAPIPFVNGLQLVIGTPAVVQLPPRVLRAQLLNFRFDTDKAFLLPESLHGIKRIVHFYNDHPGMDMVIVGHCDLRGDAGYNIRLSRDRARSIKAYLSDDFATWLRFYKESINSVAWGTREDQHMLHQLIDPLTKARYLETVTGVNDKATQDAVAAFQERNSLAKTGIGPATREEMIKLYMKEDGTTLPGNVTVHTHGCGFNHPVKPLPGDIPANRRVQIFLFDGPPSPPVPDPDKCPPCTEQPAWEKAATLKVDLEADLGDLGVQCKSSGPLAGATVRLIGPTAATDTSDEQGRADFHNLAPGTYRVVGTKDGLVAERSVVIEAGRALDAALVFNDLIQIVSADGSDQDAVAFGLWDDAFLSVKGDVRQSDPAGNDFVAADSRAFRIRVQDPDATGTTVDALWSTVTAAGADLDAPSATGAQPPAAITCEDDGSGKHVFLSPALMLVNDADDLAEPVHHGLKVAPPGPVLRTTGLYNRRIRKGSMEGSNRVRYTPAGGTTELTELHPVFSRNPDFRRRLPVQVFVMRDDTGTEMTQGTNDLFKADFALAAEIFERIGVKFGTVTGPLPAGGKLVADAATGHKFIVADHPFPVAPGKIFLSLAEQDALGTAFPMVAPKTIRVFLSYTPNFPTGKPTEGQLGSARQDANLALGLFGPAVEGCCFLQAKPRKINTFAHEIGHVATDGGHYGQPASPPNHRFEKQNIMCTTTLPTAGSGSSKRLWDDAGTSEPSQRQAIVVKPSPYTRPF